jgi:hypothetical protein
VDWCERPQRFAKEISSDIGQGEFKQTNQFTNRWREQNVMKIKPINPVIKAMIEQPNRSIKKHKSSRWKLFQSILEKETKLLKESKG